METLKNFTQTARQELAYLFQSKTYQTGHLDGSSSRGAPNQEVMNKRVDQEDYPIEWTDGAKDSNAGHAMSSTATHYTRLAPEDERTPTTPIKTQTEVIAN
ncbi:hypothetical protein PM082_014467 [Marasmius tenuissimus]|nr:hypothetical protein PM082_014467 [Marasmius tenuissimus]